MMDLDKEMITYAESAHTFIITEYWTYKTRILISIGYNHNHMHMDLKPMLLAHINLTSGFKDING